MEVQCPQCSTLLRVADEAAQSRIRCPSCQTVFAPGDRPAAPPVRSASPSDMPYIATAKPSTGGAPHIVTDNPYAPPSAGGMSSSYVRNIPNHLPLAIFSLICCGGVFAIPALIYASQANTLKAKGDYAGAARAASTAQTWLYVAFGIGIVAGILSVGLQIVAANM